MNESMNFGSIGFGNVSSVNNNAQTKPEEKTSSVISDNVVTPNVNNEKPDLMAGVKEAEERKRLEEEQAIKDFKAAHTKKSNFERDADNFSQIDFGPLKKYLEDDDITDISYSNNGQLWLKSLEKGVYRADQQDVDNELIEKIAFQCSNVMGKTFNMAHPFLDSESAELRMNFVHDSIARNGIAVVFRKTPAKIRLEKQKLLNEKYVQLSIHDFLINCVKGHCNIIVCGETGSGKTELIKYLASHTAENEKLITIEDTLELHLDRIFPHRDIVAMKTNNIASYSDVLVTCMRQNPIWILLSEVRSAEAVTAVRNSISSGHYILSTIHADKAESIPHRMYSLLESNIDVEQFLKTIYRYVQIGVFVRGRYKPEEKRFVREIAGVCEFFVTDDTNEPKFNNIYLKTVGGEETYQEPTKYIKNYLEGQGVDVTNLFGEKLSSLAQANKANGIESDVKESNGEIVHIPGANKPVEKEETPKEEKKVIEPEVRKIEEKVIEEVKEVATEPQKIEPVVPEEPKTEPMTTAPVVAPVVEPIQAPTNPFAKVQKMDTNINETVNNITTEPKINNTPIEPVQSSENTTINSNEPAIQNVLQPNNSFEVLKPVVTPENTSANSNVLVPPTGQMEPINNLNVNNTNVIEPNVVPTVQTIPNEQQVQQPALKSKFFAGLLDDPSSNQTGTLIN